MAKFFRKEQTVAIEHYYLKKVNETKFEFYSNKDLSDDQINKSIEIILENHSQNISGYVSVRDLYHLFNPKTISLKHDIEKNKWNITIIQK